MQAHTTCLNRAQPKLENAQTSGVPAPPAPLPPPAPTASSQLPNPTQLNIRRHPTDGRTLTPVAFFMVPTLQ